MSPTQALDEDQSPCEGTGQECQALPAPALWLSPSNSRLHLRTLLF